MRSLETARGLVTNGGSLVTRTPELDIRVISATLGFNWNIYLLFASNISSDSDQQPVGEPSVCAVSAEIELMFCLKISFHHQRVEIGTI